MDQTADWISKNKDVADSYTLIGTKAALMGTGLLAIGKFFGWRTAARLGLAGAGAEFGVDELDPTDTQAPEDDRAPYGGKFLHERFPGLVVPRNSPLGGGGDLTDDATRARVATARDRLASDLGISRDQAAGITSNLFAESGVRGINEQNPTSGRGGFGWAQWTGSRRIDFERWSADHGLNPASDQANIGYLEQDLQQRYPDVLRKVRAARNARDAAGAFFPYESGGDPTLTAAHLGDHTSNADRIADLPDARLMPNTPGASAVPGTEARASAHLTVEFKNAPPGTTANIVTTGPITAAAPRIGTTTVGTR